MGFKICCKESLLNYLTYDWKSAESIQGIDYIRRFCLTEVEFILVICLLSHTANNTAKMSWQHKCVNNQKRPKPNSSQDTFERMIWHGKLLKKVQSFKRRSFMFFSLFWSKAWAPSVTKICHSSEKLVRMPKHTFL